MTSESTSPAEGHGSAMGYRNAITGEWRAFAAYLRRPILPDKQAPGSSALRGTLRMAALDIMMMGAIIAILMLVVAIGFDLPDNINASLDLNPFTIALIVIAAPLLEETVFRSWLTGRPSYLVSLAALALTAIIALTIGTSLPEETGEIAAPIVLVVGAGAAVSALIALRQRKAPQWFHRIFPGLFWASSVTFALVHLLNYTEGTLAILLPLIIPQFILGTIAAYVRVRYGLISAIALHALHNGFAIGLALLAMESGMTA